jgi:hypothetical protein
MFCELKRTFLNAGLLYRPRSFNVDFELSMLNAIRSHFPNAIIHGCYFHYCQAVYRKLADDYFVEYILQYMSNDDELRELSPAIDNFADYLTTQWFENASVPQAIWNIYDRDDDDRTNNCCECWHSKWNRSSGAPHPHIWR